MANNTRHAEMLARIAELEEQLRGTRDALMAFLKDPDEADRARYFLKQLDEKLLPLAGARA